MNVKVRERANKWLTGASQLSVNIDVPSVVIELSFARPFALTVSTSQLWKLLLLLLTTTDVVVAIASLWLHKSATFIC